MSQVNKKIEECIKEISKLKEEGKFQNYIEYMVFPYFKNLQPNSKIILKFPLTVLIGKNGSGKSSTLHAFYGAPKGHSCGEFWFSTDTDPIIEAGENERNRFFYGYKQNSNSEIKEVRFARIKRSETTVKKENPDYWETTRPSKLDGMIVTENMDKRHNPVDKSVIYIDFRGALSAFDKYFYFGEPRHEKKQDLLRRKSRYLERAFKKEPLNYSPDSKGCKITETLISVTPKIINEINKILGKNYVEIKIISHKLYEQWGISVLLKNNFETKYSEANAGSGEVAIIQLVYKIMNAQPFSLILLDEPEVSLHPSAQTKLKLFLLQQINEKKHQIIISSHSPSLIQDMPANALKLFETNETGNFTIKNEVNFNEAFYCIEDTVSDIKTIICEDYAAKCLIEKCLMTLNKQHFCNVIFVPGGAEAILLQYVPAASQKKLNFTNVFIILDGDKDNDKKYVIKELTQAKLQETSTLDGFVHEVFGCKIPVYVDGNGGHGRDDQKNQILQGYLDFHNNNVFYLPDHKIPEALILECLQYDITNKNAKDIINKMTYEDHGDYEKEHKEATISKLARKWTLLKDNDNRNELISILENILNT